MQHAPELIDRFELKVARTDNCWLWQAAVSNYGYGNFTVHGRTTGAHRVAWEMANGPIPEGMFIDHLCHVKHCVRPDHLRLATRKENGENRKACNSDSTSGILGVSWSTSKQMWKGTVVHNGKHYHAGWHKDKQSCAKAVTTKRNELFTHNDVDRQTH